MYIKDLGIPDLLQCLFLEGISTSPLIHDEMLLDQLIGFSVGMVMVVSSVSIQKYSKELQMNEKY